MRVRIHNSATRSPMSQSEPLNDTGLHATRNYIPLMARILLSALFLWSGVNKMLHPAETQQYMAAAGMPLTGLFLVAAILIEVLGGLSVLLGYRARIGAIALTVFTIVATLIFHSNFAEQLQQIMFLKNLSIIGGLLMVIQHGPGNVALRFGRR